MAADLPEGIIIPLIIPFQADGEVDRSMLQQLTSFNVKAKVQGLFALGSAGQGAVMTPDQRRSALETIMEVAGGQIPVIAHVGTSESYSGRELARHAAGCGVDALAIIPPYYYSDHSEFEIQRHFCEVAEGAPELPVVVYDNAKYSGIVMNPAMVSRLRKLLPNTGGIKVSFSGLEQMLGYLRMLPDFKVYSGSIAYLVGGVPLGLAGAINPPSSFFPELCVQLWKAVTEGEYREAFDLQSRVNELRSVVGKFSNRFGRSTFTEVMRLRGFPIVRYPRWTSHSFSAEEREELRKALVAAQGAQYLVEPMLNEVKASD